MEVRVLSYAAFSSILSYFVQQEQSAVEKGLVLFFLAFLARQKGSVLDGRHKQDSPRLKNKPDHEKQVLDFGVAFQSEGHR